MKVHLIRRSTIVAFIAVHAGSRSPFNMWLNSLKYADWEIPEDICDTYGSADLLGNGSNRVVFNIGAIITE